MLLLATQRPDAKALPTCISANASARWCLKVMGQLENDMVLGTSSYKRGIRATMFSWKDKGIHYFVGEGADARIVSSIYIDAPMAEVIGLRARRLREAAGRLTGHAAGESFEERETSGFDLLADILAVVPAEEPKLWSEVVVARLGELRPDVYGGGEPSSWPPRSSRTASTPARCGARPRPGRAPTGAVSSAPASSPRLRSVTETGTRASRVRR